MKYKAANYQSPLLKFVLAVLALCFLGSGSTWVLKHYLLESPSIQAIDNALQREIQTFSNGINNYLQKQIDAVDRLAHAETTLKAIKTASGTIIKDTYNLNESITELEHAQAIYFVPSQPQTLPFKNNFIAQNIYLEALKNPQPAAIAGKIDNWVLYIARPINVDNETVGVLLAEIELDAFFSSLIKANPTTAHLTLYQELSRIHKGTLFDSGPQVNVHPTSRSTTLLIPSWRLEATATRQLTNSIATSAVPFWFSAIVIWSLLFFAAYKLFITFKPTLHGKQSSKQNRNDSGSSTTSAGPDHQEVTSFISPIPSPPTRPKPKKLEPTTRFAAHVFRDYDIRGEAPKEIDPDFAYALGCTVGKMVINRGENSLFVARDGRLTSPELSKALIEGVLASSCNVIDLGLAPTPVLNFALHNTEGILSGIMVTASHNAASDNGFKIILSQHVLSSDEIQNLHEEMEQHEATDNTSPGEQSSKNIIGNYIQAVCDDLLQPVGLKVVIDCNHGAAGVLATELFKTIGCDVIELNCSVDGSFPNHAPDPTVPENLTELMNKVHDEEADLGLAFDGDGDRIIAITGSGKIVWPDELLMIFARDVVSRNPGVDIVFDVKSTRRLPSLISNYGGRPVMWKTGHANIREKLRETDAPLAGEYSGHIFFNDRWFGFDDGLYAAVRLLEILSLREQSLDAIIAGFPSSIATHEIKIPIKDDAKFMVIKLLQSNSQFEGATCITLDGLRVEYPDGWGLVRASNTSAALTLRFEANSEEELSRIQSVIKAEIAKAAPNLPLDF